MPSELNRPIVGLDAEGNRFLAPPTGPPLRTDRVIGVCARVWVDDNFTVVELWREGPDTPEMGVRTSHKVWKRHSRGNAPDILDLAKWLARFVSDQDRRGWGNLFGDDA